MKVRILSNGGYFVETSIAGLEVEVERVITTDSGKSVFEIAGSELGGFGNNFDPYCAYSFYDSEVEIISE